MKKTLLASAVLALTAAHAVLADDKPAAPAMNKEQQQMMAAYERMSAVRAEHKQLEYFVGDWKTKSTVWMDPKKPPETGDGSSHGEAIFGGRYVETRFHGAMMGQDFEGRGFMGFDNVSGRFFSTWIDSMSTGFSLAYGSYDKASDSYTFRSTMADPMAPKKQESMRMVLHVVDASHYTLDWYEAHGGKEARTMQIEYTKQ